MKAVFIALLMCSASASAGTLYPFEDLAATPHPVPAAIEAMLSSSEADKLRNCQQQLGASDEQMQHYFTAIPLTLDGDRPAAQLVLPSKYCYAFIGSRATSFWLFLTDSPTPKLVLSGRRDTLEVLDSRSHGLPDLAVYYGSKSIRYQYDGEQYRSPDE